MKKIKKFLLGRATIVGMAILLQLYWIWFLLQGFRIRYSFVNTLIDIIAVFVVLVIVNKRSNPSYIIAWTVVILAIPVVGLVVYAIFGRSGLVRPTRIRMEAINQQLEQELPPNDEILEQLCREDKEVYRQSKYVRDWAKFPVYKNTLTKYYTRGEEMFPEMLEALEEAQHFIFMEFFIVEDGVMFGQIRDILQRKAREGVDVDRKSVV